jgi:hypothetical protein
MARAAIGSARAETLTDDAFEPELAGVAEDDRAVVPDMIIELDAGSCL